MTTIRNTLTCHHCRREMDDGATAFVANLWPYGNRPVPARVACGPCEDKRWHGALPFDRAAPCTTCGRPTRMYYAWKPLRRRVRCCSTPCLNEYLNRRRRARVPKIEPRPCATCRQVFTPPRRDG